MIKSLHWRVKVVPDLITILFVLLFFSSARSQNLSSPRITYSCKSTSLAVVVEHLSKRTGLNFIYSSDKINAKTLVSLSVSEKSLPEILEILGNQLNLSFKLQGQYIIVKTTSRYRSTLMASAAPPKRSAIKTLTTEPIPTYPRLLPNILHEGSPERSVNTSRLSSVRYTEKYWMKLQPYFDTALLKQVPAEYIRKINHSKLKKGLFFSTAAIVNDYSAGVELQTGIRQIYFVYRPSWLQDGQFHGSFGLGTSRDLLNNFSFDPVYSYASIRQTRDYNFANGIASRPVQFSNYKQKTTHHQLKLMIQYAFNKNLAIRLGPTLNYTKVTYQFPDPGKTISGVVMAKQIYREYGNATTSENILFTRATIAYPPPVSAAYDFWIGWEASFSYKIFFVK